MQKSLIIAILCLLISFLSATPRGTTQAEIPCGTAVYDKLTDLGLNQFRLRHSNYAPAFPGKMDREQWVSCDSLSLNSILPAGEHMGIQYFAAGDDFSYYRSFGNLLPAARNAVAKAPVWIKPRLEYTLSCLNQDRQLLFAGLINSASDPYVDEIAFGVAVSSPQYLNSSIAWPQLFTLNAQRIYSAAADLPYVEVIDTGSSTTGADYWSTTSYTKKDADGTIRSVAVPKDIYYWYIVLPKLTDEIPAFVDPSIVENNSSHTNNATGPDTGKFWRVMLYNEPDDGYPAMADTLVQIQTLRDLSGRGPDAIRALQWWINASMSFTSNSERPHQPARIYRKHFGRCGEYADLTAAAARTALIPCTSILSMSTDHTWNEFWDEEWTMWEPVNGYIDVPMVYEQGWGKVFGSVFEIRGDGYLASVTGTYSSGLAQINLMVKDQEDRPVDGSRVILAIQEGGMKTDMVGFTDNQGLVSFPVGENRSYYARAETSFGIYPPIAGTYSELVQNVADGAVHYFEMEIPGSLPVITINPVEPPSVPDPLRRFQTQYQVPGYYISGRVTWDDIFSLGDYPDFLQPVAQPGELNLLVTDADNYIFWDVMQTCDAYLAQTASAGSTATFNLPAVGDHYAILDNSHRHGNAQQVNGFLLGQLWGTTHNADPQQTPSPIRLSVYPNPFEDSVLFQYTLPKASPVGLEVYNLRGQKLITLIPEQDMASSGVISWDGRDSQGRHCAAGIYLLRLNSGGESSTIKLLRLK